LWAKEDIMKGMNHVLKWVESEDAVEIRSEINGWGRGDGYDCGIYRSQSTGRYIVIVGKPQKGFYECYVAKTLKAAEACIAHGYTPGSAPGQYQPISNARRLKEVQLTPNVPETTKSGVWGDDNDDKYE
jgi:hypothetical protein